jgi:hypothetical protein
MEDLIPEAQQKRCRDIGALLCAIGGIELMRQAYYAVRASNRYAAAIQAY